VFEIYFLCQLDDESIHDVSQGFLYIF